MATATLAFSGVSILCLLDAPDWSGGLRLRYALPVQIEEGLSGRENRRASADSLRISAALRWFMDGTEAQALREALAGLGGGLIGLPLWTDALTGAEWATRVHDPEVIIDLTAIGLLPKGADMEPDHLYAPLLVGRLEETPELAPFTGEHSTVALRVTEDAGHAFRIGVNAVGVPGTWPAELVPDWAEAPRERAVFGVERINYGRGREAALEGTEKAFRWGEEAGFQLLERAELRTLLAFFLASRGPRTPFAQTWWYRPGVSTPPAPHASTVRFASERIDLEFETPILATARLSFLQVPWEVAGVVGETPAEAPFAYLYRFTLDVPGGPLVWRFTDWERDLERVEGGATATYQARPIEHDQISQDYRLGDDPVEITSAVFADHPFLRFISRTLEAPLKAEILICDPAAPAAAELRYVGEVSDVKTEGRRLSAETTVLAGALDLKVPSFLVQATCNYAFCGFGCGLSEAAWTFGGTLVSVSGNEVVVSVTANPPGASLVNDYFAKAWLAKGSGASYETRDIIRSVNLGGGQQRFTLKRAFASLAAGQAFTFRPYCGGTWAECKTKFNNTVNFGGHRHVQIDNPSLPSRQSTQSAGGKK